MIMASSSISPSTFIPPSTGVGEGGYNNYNSYNHFHHYYNDNYPPHYNTYYPRGSGIVEEGTSANANPHALFVKEEGEAMVMRSGSSAKSASPPNNSTNNNAELDTPNNGAPVSPGGKMGEGNGGTVSGAGTVPDGSKVCGVCGDRALGNNFNAITCESCKAFFRRNALRSKPFLCPFQDNCKVDPITRRFCQKCRLKKCFDIGMKKEWIMTDEEKKMKKEKIQQNRAKRAARSPPSRSSNKVSRTSEDHENSNSNNSFSNESLSGVMPPTSTIDQIVAAADVIEGKRNFPWGSSLSPGGPVSVSLPVEVEGIDGGDAAAAGDSDAHPILSSLVRPGGSPGDDEINENDNESGDGESPLPLPLLEYPNKKQLIQQYNQDSSHNQQEEHRENMPYILPPPIDPPAPNPNPVKEESNEPPLELPPLPLNTMDSILSVAISAEFNGALGDPPSPQGDGVGDSHNHISTQGNLNRAERSKLSELFFATEALNAPVDQDGPVKIQASDPSLINVINLTDIAIRRLIKMSKKISAFSSLCQEDQIALLKGSCTEMMILRSVVSYDPERDSWNIPHSAGLALGLHVLRKARSGLYEEHQRFVRSFRPEWRMDAAIMTILCAVTLFTPQRPNVRHPQVVKLEQDSYYYLLKRYLETRYSGCEAKLVYLELIQRVAELHVLNSAHLRVFLELNPRDVEPLLIEIFDLKQ